VHAGAQEPLDMGGCGREIDGLVRLEVGGDGRVHALPLRHGLPFFRLGFEPEPDAAIPGPASQSEPPMAPP
jgi:hypothetical protein